MSTHPEAPSILLSSVGPNSSSPFTTHFVLFIPIKDDLLEYCSSRYHGGDSCILIAASYAAECISPFCSIVDHIGCYLSLQ